MPVNLWLNRKSLVVFFLRRPACHVRLAPEHGGVGNFPRQKRCFVREILALAGHLSECPWRGRKTSTFSLKSSVSTSLPAFHVNPPNWSVRFLPKTTERTVNLPAWCAAGVQTIEEQRRLFQKRKWRLIGDNVFLGLLGTSGAWCASVKAAASFGLGATLGTAYIVLLSRFVESLGSTDESGGISSGGGSARLVLAVLLVLIVSKNKETFELVPAVAGFLGYQVGGVYVLAGRGRRRGSGE